MKELNKRKAEIVDSMERMLKAAVDSKRQLSSDEETAYSNMERELGDTNKTIARMDAIAKGKTEVGEPTSTLFVPQDKLRVMTFSADYHKAFYAAFRNPAEGFRNAALGEGGTTDGGYLVPSRVDGTIVPLAPQEHALRQVSLVIPTTMDIKLPTQAAKTTAVAKTESRTGDNAFGGVAPTFGQVTLSAFMAGTVVPITIELAQDVPALEPFLNADVSRGVANYEEDKFCNGSGSGEPQGCLTGATAAQSAALSVDASLDMLGKLKASFHPNAVWLMNRSTAISMRKKQLAADQFQTFWTNSNGQDYLHSYPVYYSEAMAVYCASPSVQGKVIFGSFKDGFVIGDRTNGIAIRVDDLTELKYGKINVYGYRRTDSRVRIAEALQAWSITG